MRHADALVIGGLLDSERDFHRAEHLQQIPEPTLTHQQLYPYRSDSESVHSQFDRSMWNSRMISYGLGGVMPSRARTGAASPTVRLLVAFWARAKLSPPS
jgi:hypothetical protein